jgi:Prophage protein (DUF1660)
MLKTLLCKLNLGHHWLAAADPDGSLRRHCTRCGKYDRRGAKWFRRLAKGDRPADDGSEGVFPANPYM